MGDGWAPVGKGTAARWGLASAQDSPHHWTVPTCC